MQTEYCVDTSVKVGLNTAKLVIQKELSQPLMEGYSNETAIDFMKIFRQNVCGCVDYKSIFKEEDYMKEKNYLN